MHLSTQVDCRDKAEIKQNIHLLITVNERWRKWEFFHLFAFSEDVLATPTFENSLSTMFPAGFYSQLPQGHFVIKGIKVLVSVFEGELINLINLINLIIKLLKGQICCISGSTKLQKSPFFWASREGRNGNWEDSSEKLWNPKGKCWNEANKGKENEESKGGNAGKRENGEDKIHILGRHCNFQRIFHEIMGTLERKSCKNESWEGLASARTTNPIFLWSEAIPNWKFQGIPGNCALISQDKGWMWGISGNHLFPCKI